MVWSQAFNGWKRLKTVSRDIIWGPMSGSELLQANDGDDESMLFQSKQVRF